MPLNTDITHTSYCFLLSKKVGRYVKSFPRHYAFGSHEGLYGQCLNLVSVVRSNLECSYTDSLGRDTSPSKVPSKQCLYSFGTVFPSELSVLCTASAGHLSVRITSLYHVSAMFYSVVFFGYVAMRCVLIEV